MAVIDTNKIKKPYIVDRDEDVSIGIDFPLRRGGDVNTDFAATSTTLEAVKNNVRNLLMTEHGERVMQPNLGVRLKQFLFEQFNDDVRLSIENVIVDACAFWLPFVEIVLLDINMSENTSGVGNNTLKIFVEFSLKKDPTTIESVQINIGG